MAGLNPGPSGEETRDVLAAVLEDQAARKQRREAPPRPQSRDWNRVAALAVVPLAILALWIVIAPPRFLRPPPVPVPTPQAVRTGLHMDIYLVAAQVIRYRRDHGQLPDKLVDALAEPAAAEGLSYAVGPGGVFEIAGERAGESVVYRSTEPLREFAAEAVAAVKSGAGS